MSSQNSITSSSQAMTKIHPAFVSIILIQNGFFHVLEYVQIIFEGSYSKYTLTCLRSSSHRVLEGIGKK